MERMSVKSELLKSIGYDPIKKVLEIEFINGDIYQYQNVPEFKYMTLNASEPADKYFNEFIKNKFKYVKKNLVSKKG